jgi:hypothetical protein
MEWNGKAAWGSNRPGAQVRFKFTGTKVGLFVWSSNGQSEEELGGPGGDERLRREKGPGQGLCWIEEPEMSEEEWEEKIGGTKSTEAQSWLLNSHIPTRYAAGPECVLYFVLLLSYSFSFFFSLRRSSLLMVCLVLSQILTLFPRAKGSWRSPKI